MEGKEEISDSDSGIILHSGPDSPKTIMKDTNTHTRAMKLKHQLLEDRLELCLMELRKLCIREAELTGQLSLNYPVLPGEKPPHVWRRIGAEFKLDEQSISQGPLSSDLNSVEAELALQLQIYEAARRLCREEHLSKAVKKSRLQQCKREEKKVKKLQETEFQLRLQHSRSSPHQGVVVTQGVAAFVAVQGISEDSLLSDSTFLDDEVTHQSSGTPVAPLHQGQTDSPKPYHESPQAPLNVSAKPSSVSSSSLSQNPSEEPRLGFNTCMDGESPPIKHSPWTESSLDEPYRKTKNSRSSSTKSSSSAVTLVLPPVEACFEEPVLPQQLSHLKLCQNQSSSAPSTPEMQLRRQFSLRIPHIESSLGQERDRSRSRTPRRRLTDYVVTTPESLFPRKNYGDPMFNSGSEDSNSEHSAPSYTSSPCREVPCDLTKQCQPLHRYPFVSPIDNHGPLAFPSCGVYQNSKLQSNPNFHRGYCEEEMCYSPEVDITRRYYCQRAPYPSHRREDWYEEVPVHLQRSPMPLPHHITLSRTPSLREYPHHLSGGLPRQVIDQELRSWHQRNQLGGTRPRSLDRQGAMRVKNTGDRKSPLAQHHKQQEKLHSHTTGSAWKNYNGWDTGF